MNGNKRVHWLWTSTSHTCKIEHKQSTNQSTNQQVSHVDRHNFKTPVKGDVGNKKTKIIPRGQNKSNHVLFNFLFVRIVYHEDKTENKLSGLSCSEGKTNDFVSFVFFSLQGE